MLKRFTYTRIHADEHGESHFERLEVELGSQGAIGWLSEKFPVSTMEFRVNAPDYDRDYHTAPARQFIILLNGAIEITTSLGEARRFGQGISCSWRIPPAKDTRHGTWKRLNEGRSSSRSDGRRRSVEPSVLRSPFSDHFNMK